MKTGKFNLKKGAALTAPFLLFFAGVVLLTLWAAQVIRAESVYNSYFSLLFRQNDTTVAEDPSDAPQLILPVEPESEYLEGSFVMPNYGKQWATLNISGFQVRDIPVYYGDSPEILAKGAGQFQMSRLSGQNGKVVLSAHVNRHFYELEDAAARFENGEEVLITVDALWGTYVYRVDDVVIFNYRDVTPLDVADGEESIFLYTCYPRENAFSFKEERLGLHATLISGATWREYAER